MKSVTITVESTKDSLNRAARAFEEAQNRKLKSAYVLAFSDLSTLRKTLTEKRLDLLAAVGQHRPESLYELSKLVDRDLKSVRTDIKILGELGLVSLEKSISDRKKVRPRLEYDQLNIKIPLVAQKTVSGSRKRYV